MKKLKGNVTIKLFDEDGNVVHEESKDNMITNAIYYLLGQVITNVKDPKDYVFPLSTLALGGIWLFDGELDEDAENIDFPMDVHLVGHGGQSQNTSDIMRGSLNVSESGRTDTGYVNTWDFSTSQGNGTIKSVALTSWICGDAPLRFDRGATGCKEIHTHDSSNYYGSYVFFHDNVTQRAFSYKNNAIYSFNCPSYDLKVNDPLYISQVETVISPLIEAVSTTTERIEFVDYSICQGYDNYLYAIAVNREWVKVGSNYYWDYGRNNAQGDAEIWIRKWHYEDNTFVEVPYSQEDPRWHYTLLNVHAKGLNPDMRTGKYAIINNGYLWMVHYDNLHVYKINMEDMAQISLYGPFNDLAINGLYPMKHGGVITSTGILIYPDGNFIYKGNDFRFPQSNYIGDNLIRFTGGSSPTVDANGSGDTCSNRPKKAIPCNYLGSIMNLGQTITKTSATSMKIIYTLTDAEYEEENDG